MNESWSFEISVVSLAVSLWLPAIDRLGWATQTYARILLWLGSLVILIGIGWPAYGPVFRALAGAHLVAPTPQQLAPALIAGSLAVASAIWLAQKWKNPGTPRRATWLVTLAINLTTMVFLVFFALLAVFAPPYFQHFLEWNPTLAAVIMIFGGYRCVRALESG